MIRDGYALLAPVYDRLNSTVDYKAWADFLESCFGKFGGIPIRSVLDLGCGTGSMTLELARRGYDMTGIDLSAEMLSVADSRIRAAGLEGVLLAEEDMRSFELYRTVDAVVCCLDGVNHLTNRDDLLSCLDRVSNYLNPGGLFLFDLNTPYKFAHNFSDRDYILEEKGLMCCWRNRLNRAGDLADFYFTLFRETKNGLWEREEGYERERAFSLRQIKRALQSCGLELLNVSSDFSFTAPADDTMRWYITAGKRA